MQYPQLFMITFSDMVKKAIITYCGRKTAEVRSIIRITEYKTGRE